MPTVTQRCHEKLLARPLSGHLALAVVALGPLLAGCPASVPPPPSQLPTAGDALARMKATYACSNALKATDVKLDYAGDRGRVRGNASLFVGRPQNVRIDIWAPPPLNSAVDTLTSDGRNFALRDTRNNRFYVGPATACNIARLTTVNVPGHVLVSLFRGVAPVLKHDASAAQISWSTKGYYVVTVPSTRDANEEIHLRPRAADWTKPWDQQKLQVTDVRVVQQGFVLYHAELDEHAPAPMDTPVEPAFPGDDSALPLSGPPCDVDVPRRIRLEVPDKNEDVRFRYTSVYENPPLPSGEFTQSLDEARGLQVVPVTCDDGAQ
jgi:hypothetical protein